MASRYQTRNSLLVFFIPPIIPRLPCSSKMFSICNYPSYVYVPCHSTDRPPCLQNLLVPEESEALALKKDELKKKEDGGDKSTCLLVAIDSGVSRRPPGMKIEHDRRVYSKTIELLLHDEYTAANLLREISFGYLGPPFENEPTSNTESSNDPTTTLEEVDHQKVTKAFQRGVTVGIRDMQILRMFLIKLYRTLDQLLREFMVYMSSQSEVLKKQESSPSPEKMDSPTEVAKSSADVKDIQENTPKKLPWSPSRQESPQVLSSCSLSTPIQAKSPRLSTLKVSPPSLRKSPGSSPRVNSPNRISPLRENWHGKGSSGRMTFKLKDVSKSAKVCFSLLALR